MSYGRSERDAYWEKIKYIIGQIAKNDFSLWTADNNGKIARPIIISDRGRNINTMAHIGQWHYAMQSEKKMGIN